MAKKYALKIVHLYPEILNLYGDIGNVITLQKRCEWRNIKVSLVNLRMGDSVPSDGDIYFVGGGQDQDEDNVYQALLKQKKNIEKSVNEDAVYLCVCAGFQLFGKHYINAEGKKLPGLGILDIETRSPGSGVSKRCIGNIVTKLNADSFSADKLPLDTLVGFENHTGQTYLGKKATLLSTVISGNGNNLEDDTEGAVQKSVYGCYLHGLLYKNTHFADHLILQALKRKYGGRTKLSKLDDSLEHQTHTELVKRFGT